MILFKQYLNTKKIVSNINTYWESSFTTSANDFTKFYQSQKKLY